MPVRTVFDGVEWTLTQGGDRQIVEYRTPVGVLTTVTIYDEAMRTSGATITHVARYAFSGPQWRTFPAAAFLRECNRRTAC